MAESILAFGIALNIVQFVDFSCRVLSTGYQMYKSSSTVFQENQDLEVVTIDLHKVTDNIDTALQQARLEKSPSPNDLQLQQLAEQCRAVCGELLTALEQLKTHGQLGKWNIFRAALQTVWKESKIEASHKRVEQFRQELIACILVSFR